MNSFKQYLTDLYKRKDLLVYLVTSSLKADTRNTFLGYFWWLLDPFLMVVVYLFVRIVFMGTWEPNDIAFLAVGLVVFQYFSKCLTVSASAVVSKAGLITQVYLPKAIFPFSVVLTQLINFSFGMVTVGLILVVLGIRPGVELAWLPAIVAAQTLFLLALSLLVAYIAAFVRDIGNVLGHITMILRFSTPVIWEADRIPDRFRWFVDANPITWQLNAYRDVLMYGRSPNLELLTALAAGSALLVVLLLLHYTFNEHRIIKVM